MSLPKSQAGGNHDGSNKANHNQPRPVITWHRIFFARHTDRFPRSDWPEGDSGFWDDWEQQLVDAGVTSDEAQEASMAMFKEGEIPKYISEHPRSILDRIKAVWRARKAAAAPTRQPIADSTGWNRAAEAHWASLSEADRADARQLVRERMPELAGHPHWLEGLAKGWSYDPAVAAGDPPPPERPGAGPKRIGYRPPGIGNNGKHP